MSDEKSYIIIGSEEHKHRLSKLPGRSTRGSEFKFHGLQRREVRKAIETVSSWPMKKIEWSESGIYFEGDYFRLVGIQSVLNFQFAYSSGATPDGQSSYLLLCARNVKSLSDNDEIATSQAPLTKSDAIELLSKLLKCGLLSENEASLVS